MGVYSRPPSQDDDTDKLFFEELRDGSKSTALEDFNLPEINWDHHTADTTQARRFLKHLHHNFMEQVLRELSWKDYLDLLLVSREDEQSEHWGQLSHIDHRAIKFKISGDRRKSARKTSTLAMRRADLRLLRELVSRVPWEMLLQVLWSISAG